MTEDEVLELLQKSGAFRAGHFVLTTGRHSDSYVNKDALYTYAHDTGRLCKEMAERFKNDGIEVVIGPAVAAAILSQWTAYHMTDMVGREVFATYADKDGKGGFVIKRGYDQLMAGKKVLVVEDLTTTGSSIVKVVAAAKAAGAEIVGVCVLCNRGRVTAEMTGAPKLEALLNVELDSWEAKDCDLCKNEIPVNTDIGHGKEFLAHNPKRG
jgi:orotate phosphoribosyltransferase